MLPFSIEFRKGESVYKQLIYAVKRAFAAGQLQPGDMFPSVRILSQELKINPNTAHKAVSALIEEGLLEVKTGIGTTLASPIATKAQRRALLLGDTERVVVEARRLGLELEDVLNALRQRWHDMTKR